MANCATSDILIALKWSGFNMWRRDQQSTGEERDWLQEKPSHINRVQRRPQPIRMLVSGLKLSG
ncbi:MAG: hypothetical protein C0630_15970 [Sedimenticola selenatireducens]|uniref:Uncharacterized protein n=1 Tax=Sedimenticola selenatireducens TaxID=191960 RepID=A0A2N6CT48_9GAMM|nr:MAG: hypothetical protein C0630_15970 [Sedimenticola selenatireducens]